METGGVLPPQSHTQPQDRLQTTTTPLPPKPTKKPKQEPTAYFHEISHNLGANHAGKWDSRGYEDMSGAMGYCCDVRCHNAPHSHQARSFFCARFFRSGNAMCVWLGHARSSLLYANLPPLLTQCRHNQKQTTK
jgi:hypothetical protein